MEDVHVSDAYRARERSVQVAPVALQDFNSATASSSSRSHRRKPPAPTRRPVYAAGATSCSALYVTTPCPPSSCLRVRQRPTGASPAGRPGFPRPQPPSTEDSAAGSGPALQQLKPGPVPAAVVTDPVDQAGTKPARHAGHRAHWPQVTAVALELVRVPAGSGGPWSRQPAGGPESRPAADQAEGGCREGGRSKASHRAPSCKAAVGGGVGGGGERQARMGQPRRNSI